MQDGSDLTMVDTGIPGSEPERSAAFAELGYRRNDLRRIVLTHGHEDHAGSAEAVRAWGDIEVLAHRNDAPIVRGRQRRPDPDLTSAEQPIYDQVTASMPALPPCPVDTELVDGDTLEFGDARVVATPGHTDGSMAVWLPTDGVLLTGDIVANGSAGLLLGPFNTDRAQARQSVVALAQLPARTVGFGHGDPLVHDAGAQLWREFSQRCSQGPHAVPDPLG